MCYALIEQQRDECPAEIPEIDKDINGNHEDAANRGKYGAQDEHDGEHMTSPLIIVIVE